MATLPPRGEPEDVRHSRLLFDGQRLRVARELRQLSQQELGRRAGGISGAAVSQFEQGQTTPRIRSLELLTQALGFPVSFFARDSRPDALETPAFFRSLRSTTVRRRNSARAFAEIARLLVLTLERHVEFPPLDLPVMSISEATPLEEVEILAGRARRSMGLSQSEPIPDVVGLLEQHGAVCLRWELNAEGIDAFSVPYVDRPLVVLGADKGKRDRSRFDAAHELGHLVMHSTHAMAGVKPLEDQAHRFAAAFLMPRDGIREQLPAGPDWMHLLALKRHWGTSIAALLYRAKTLGIMTETTFERAMRSLSARGWRVDEPGDLGAPESPRLLYRALEHLKVAAWTTADLSEEAGISEDDLAMIQAASSPTRPRIMP